MESKQESTVSSVGTVDLGSSSSPTVATSEITATKEDKKRFIRYAVVTILLLLLLSGIAFLLTIATLNILDKDDEEKSTGMKSSPGDSDSKASPPEDISPTPTDVITRPKPIDPSYAPFLLRGLICQSTYYKAISIEPPSSCSFVMVDIETREPSAQPGDSGPTVPLVPSDITPLFAHLKKTIRTIILSHNGSLLRQTTRASLPQILRGLRKNLVENKAHGLALRWPLLVEADLAALLQQAKLMSDELDEYHGLIRYDKYSGSTQALTNFMIEVGRLDSMTMVYQVSGRTSIFTNPYYPNFYLDQMKEKPLVTLIEEEVVKPIIAAGGNVTVAISMSLMARRCAVSTVYNATAQPLCSSVPLDTAQICKLRPAYIQGHYYSLMTRRYKGGNDSTLTEDVFFETQHTVAKKAYLMLKQLKRANVKPLAFIIEGYDMDVQQGFIDNHTNSVTCAAKEHGIQYMTTDELEKVI